MPLSAEGLVLKTRGNRSIDCHICKSFRHLNLFVGIFPKWQPLNSTFAPQDTPATSASKIGHSNSMVQVLPRNSVNNCDAFKFNHVVICSELHYEVTDSAEFLHMATNWDFELQNPPLLFFVKDGP